CLFCILHSLACVFAPVYCDRPTLPSFPTRRSSDLGPAARALAPRTHRDHGGPPPPALQSVVRRHRPHRHAVLPVRRAAGAGGRGDRKSTRLNSSHVKISYAVFCLKKKKKKPTYKTT